jgi:chromosome segregation ATPase
VEVSGSILVLEDAHADLADRAAVVVIDQDEENWLMASQTTGDRIEAKLDRLVGAINELHRELGAVLARDAEQEKNFNRQMESISSARSGLDGELHELEAKHEQLQREFDKTIGAHDTKIAIMMRIVYALGATIFGLLVHLFSKLLAGG